MRITSLLLIFALFVVSSYSEDYVSLTYYSDASTCTGNPAAYQNIVLNNCFSKTGVSSNIKFTYDSTSNTLMKSFFSDLNCSMPLAGAANITLNSCQEGVKYLYSPGTPLSVGATGVTLAAMDPVGNDCSPSSSLSIVIDACFFLGSANLVKFTCLGENVEVGYYSGKDSCAGNATTSFMVTNSSCNTYKILKSGPCVPLTSTTTGMSSTGMSTTTASGTTSASSTALPSTTSGAVIGTTTSGSTTIRASTTTSGVASGTTTSPDDLDTTTTGVKVSTTSGVVSPSTTGLRATTTAKLVTGTTSSTSQHASATSNIVNLFVVVFGLVCVIVL